MNQELYDSIKESIGNFIRLKTDAESLFLHEVTLSAVAGTEKYLASLEEAISYLKILLVGLLRNKLDTA